LPTITGFADAHAVLEYKIFPIAENAEKAAKLLALRERESLAVHD
jgi:hypothetical protein